MEIVAEKWLPVVGFEGSYEVSSEGRVRRLARVFRDASGRQYALPARDMKISSRNGWYPKVDLNEGGLRSNRFVHRLVAEAFLGSPEGRNVNHINGIKTDCRLSNLEYVTQSENVRHALDAGLTTPQHKRKCAKLTSEAVVDIRRGRSLGKSYKFLGAKHGVSAATARDACLGRTWRHVST